MSDYIKREDALNALREYPVTKLKTAIRRLPSADVAPVRHGMWIAVDCGDFEECVCSICGNANFGENYLIGSEANYCPNCGARMDGEEDETD